MKSLIIILLLLGALVCRAGILFTWTDVNPPGTIDHFNFYGSQNTNSLGTNLLGTISYVPLPGIPLFKLTNTIVGTWYFQVTAVSHEGIETKPSNMLIIYAPIPLTLSISATNKNQVGP